MGSISRVADTPNAVIAALAVSTCVAALSGYVVVSTALPQMMRPSVSAGMASVDALPRPVPRPGARVRPLIAPADPAVVALGFEDPGLARVPPPPIETPEMASAPAPRLHMPVRIVEGRPAIVPPPRPGSEAGPVRLARGLTAARALGLPSPAPRPEGLAGEPATARAGVPPRPALRPATLSTRAPEPAETQVALAAAEPPETAAQPRSAAPVQPRAGANPCSTRLARAIPRRPGNAAGGSAVMDAVGDASGSGRDAALVAEALRGNLPSHLRDLQPVHFTGLAGGQQTRITLCVTPDYLAIGSDADHVRVPLGLPAALRVADAFDMMLPTTRMVDAIHSQADLRVAPSPMTPGAAMSSTGYFLRHDATIDAQFDRAGARDGLLVAGHKKDLVIANRLARAPGRVAIYGWHRSNGAPIQPLSTVHGEYYADYSHGIRLVSRTAYLEGRAVDLRGLLTDGHYAGLLNSDGPLSGATVSLAALR